MADPENHRPIAQLAGITIDVSDLELEKEFWRTVLATEITDESDKWVIFKAQPGCAGLSLQQVPEGKTIKNRAHPDLKMADFDQGIRRLEELGAKVIRPVSSGNLRWVIMADPEGNEFCAVG